MAAFYLDEDVPEALATLLIAYGHVAVTTRAEGRKGTPDYMQLGHAALQGWVFVALNRKDYLLLQGAWRLWGVAMQHPGILIAPHVPRIDPPVLAAGIETLVTEPGNVLDDMLYQWTGSGWH